MPPPRHDPPYPGPAPRPRPDGPGARVPRPADARVTAPLPPLPGSAPAAPTPAPRRRPGRRFAALAVPALVGGLVAVGGVALTGNLGGDETRVVTVPAALGGGADADPSGADPAVSPPPAAGLAVQEIVRRSSPAVIAVEVVTDQSAQSGTGFLIDGNGTALTNEHVVEDATEVTVEFSDLSTSKAKVLGTDPDTDLAVLRVEEVPAGTRPLALGRSGALAVGDPVVAIGNPFGFARTVTTGIVSALERRIDSPGDFDISNAIQTDAAINQGNSGGPLLDSAGRVIGINSQIFSRGGGSDGVGFAVPADTIRPVARSILATGRAEHAWVGITGRSLTPETAEAIGAKGRTGVVLLGVDERGPSAKAGLKAAADPDAAVPRGADVIVAIDGRRIDGMEDVSQAVSSRAVGDEIAVTVLRGGSERTVRLRLQDRPADVGRTP